MWEVGPSTERGEEVIREGRVRVRGGLWGVWGKVETAWWRDLEWRVWEREEVFLVVDCGLGEGHLETLGVLLRCLRVRLLLEEGGETGRLQGRR